MCLAAGAAACITLEYNALRYDHPGTHTFTVAEWQEGRSRGTQCQMPISPFNCRFDAIWSISSFEHDGLGRYGDPIDPDGDLRAMKSTLDLLDPARGLLYLSVPVGGDDAVHWNEGRVYGPIRLPLLLQGLDIEAGFGLSPQDIGDPLSMARAEQRHARMAPKEAFQPVLVLSAEQRQRGLVS